MGNNGTLPYHNGLRAAWNGYKKGAWPPAKADDLVGVDTTLQGYYRGAIENRPTRKNHPYPLFLAHNTSQNHLIAAYYTEFKSFAKVFISVE
jgi:hypothetical protein